MFTVTQNLLLPSCITGSWPRPRWFDLCMWGRPLDSCMMDVRYREQFQDALAVVISDQERAGLDILSHGDFHLDEDMAGRCWATYPLQRFTGLDQDHVQAPENRHEWLVYNPGTLLYEIYAGWRWPWVVDKIEHAPLHYVKIWRMAQARAHKPVRFGTVCTQVSSLFLDIHTPKYKDKREVIWDLAVAMNAELVALRDAGCKCIQLEEPCLHFMCNTYGRDNEMTKFMLEAYNREVQGLDDVEIWIHTCWGNPNMQRVREDTNYAAAMDMYLGEARGDVWTVEMKDRDLRELELFGNYRNSPKKVCVGAVSHRTLQADRGEDVAAVIREALKHIPVEKLIVGSDCGFGRQGCNREIAFYKASAIAQGCNIVRRELGLPETYVAAADPALQTDLVEEGI